MRQVPLEGWTPGPLGGLVSACGPSDKRSRARDVDMVPNVLLQWLEQGASPLNSPDSDRVGLRCDVPKEIPGHRVVLMVPAAEVGEQGWPMPLLLLE
jgi:hypothetical protein